MDKENRKQEVGEMGDAMRALENIAMYSKQDMDILAALEEMLSMKVRSGHLAILLSSVNLYLYMHMKYFDFTYYWHCFIVLYTV